MKKNQLLLCLVFTILYTGLFAQGVQPTGSGTSGDPYQIATLANLQWLVGAYDDYNKWYIQTANISTNTYVSIGWSSNPFTGHYDGQGFTITGIYNYFPSSDQIGMFGKATGATISNLNLENASIHGTNDVGALIGEAIDITVTNCHVTGSLVHNYNYGDNVGGLIGELRYGSQITNCSFNGWVEGTMFNAGGLIGYASSSSSLINECFADVHIDGYYMTGGLIGKNFSIVRNCFSSGTVDGNDYTGGLIGSISYGSVKFCYSTSAITGNNDVGGFCGYKASGATCSNNFWDTETSGYPTSHGATGKTSSEMKDVTTYTDLNTVGLDTPWDFVNNPNDDEGSSDIWNIHDLMNDGYPYLSFETTPAIFMEITSTFNSISTNGYSHPEIADIDNDGLMDLLIGDAFGRIDHFEQDALNSFAFTLVDTYFNSIDVGWNSAPRLADLDGDGLLDLLVGTDDGNIRHYEQDEYNSYVFSLITSDFNTIDVGSRSTPCFTDLDNDGLLDLLIGNSYGKIHHYEQNTINSTSFTLISNLFSSIDYLNSVSPSLIDIDGDGLLDLLLGDYPGNIHYYQQDSPNSTTFSLITEDFNNIDVGDDSSPTFSDLDGDGKLDMLIGESNSNINHWEAVFETINTPCVITSAPIVASATSVTLGGEVTDNNSMPVLRRGVCYSFSNSNPTLNDSQEIMGSGFGVFSGTIPHTFDAPCYFRAFISSSLGTFYGDVEIILPDAPIGSGTVGDPYQIATINDLLWLSYTSSSWDKHFIQTADIDASVTSTWNGGEGFSPIGIDETNYFSGKYDGQGFVIDGLTINRPSGDHQALFGNTQNAEISNLGVINVSITGDDRTAALVAINNITPITNSYTTGTVNGDHACGGLVGYNITSDISFCYSTVNVGSTSNHVGGLMGRSHNNSNISNCYSRGSVNAGGNVGGLIGYLTDCTVENCYSTGFVTATSSPGGLIGIGSGSTVTSSFWATETSGQSTSAGGTGKTTAEMINVATFTDLTTAGLGTPWDFVGNLNDDTGNDDNWNLFYFINDGYPFLSWQANPVVPLAGRGTPVEPFQIANIDDLEWLSNDTIGWSSYFIQTANIDASATSTWNGGEGFSPIGLGGTNSFSGSYDGQGFSIDGLTINRSDNRQSLFGYTNGATISNLGTTNVNINGTSQSAGLVGFNTYSTITNCYTSGNISGDWTTAGLIGRNDSSMVSQCYSSANINATGNHNGGLIGANDWNSIVENCYATGNIIATEQNIGGLVGENQHDAEINNCYSAGNVSGGTGYVGGLVGRNHDGAIVNNSFWDTETSGQATSAGGTGKTTLEMKDVATFTNLTTVGLDSPWDFVGDPNDDTGIEDIWDIDPVNNNGYPYFSWQTFETGIELDLAVFLEGPYNGTGMNTYLNPSYIPLSQPYNVAPWNYVGTESVASIPADVVDWVLIELRDTTDASLATGETIIARQAAFLLNDGSFVDTAGTDARPCVSTSVSNNLFVVIWHRNHLGIMSANPLTQSGGVYTYDFSTDVNQAFQSGEKLVNGKAVMFGGDMNADGSINTTDKTIFNNEAGTVGYLNSDVTMNGQSDNKDKNDVWVPNNGAVSGIPD